MKAKTLVPFVALTTPCIFLRTILALMGIDPDTRFFGGVKILLFVFPVLWVAEAAILMHTWFSQGKGNPSQPLKGSIPLGITAILLGLAVEFTSYQDTVDIFRRMGGRPHNLFFVLAVFLGCLSCVVLIIQGMFLFQKRGGLPIVLLLLPVLWMLSYLIAHFTTYATLRSHPDQQLFVAFLLCSLIFLMDHARVLSNTPPSGMDRVVLFGYFVAMLGFPLSIPHLVGAVAGRFPMGQGIGSSEVLVALACSVYALCFSVTYDNRGVQMGWVKKL